MNLKWQPSKGKKWQRLDSGREGFEDANWQQQQNCSNKTCRITQRHTLKYKFIVNVMRASLQDTAAGP